MKQKTLLKLKSKPFCASTDTEIKFQLAPSTTRNLIYSGKCFVAKKIFVTENKYSMTRNHAHH